MTVNCKICKKEIVTSEQRIKKGHGKFCSRKCFFLAHKKKIVVQCESCGVNIERIPSLLKKNKHQFCSIKCSIIWKKKYVKERPEAKDNRRKILSASRKGSGNPMFGRRNYNWRGCSDLSLYIRTCSFMIDWKKAVFEKNNYSCSQCGDDSGGNLNAHHKKPFRILFSEFLGFYNQFSPIEDKETLSRLAYSYAPFWDKENGVCLCENCHKEIHKKEKENVILA